MYVEAVCIIGAAESHVTASGVAAASPGEQASSLAFAYLSSSVIAIDA